MWIGACISVCVCTSKPWRLFTFFSRSVASCLNFSSDSLLVFSNFTISSASFARIFISFASARAVATSPCAKSVPNEIFAKRCTQIPVRHTHYHTRKISQLANVHALFTTCNISISAAMAAMFSWLRFPRTEYGSTELFESANDSSAGNAESVWVHAFTQKNHSCTGRNRKTCKFSSASRHVMESQESSYCCAWLFETGFYLLPHHPMEL